MLNILVVDDERIAVSGIKKRLFQCVKLCLRLELHVLHSFKYLYYSLIQIRIENKEVQIVHKSKTKALKN